VSLNEVAIMALALALGGVSWYLGQLSAEIKALRSQIWTLTLKQAELGQMLPRVQPDAAPSGLHFEVMSSRGGEPIITAPDESRNRD
jgi:hypothetical protein